MPIARYGSLDGGRFISEWQQWGIPVGLVPPPVVPPTPPVPPVETLFGNYRRGEPVVAFGTDTEHFRRLEAIRGIGLL